MGTFVYLFFIPFTLLMADLALLRRDSILFSLPAALLFIHPIPTSSLSDELSYWSATVDITAFWSPSGCGESGWE
jgi:hypothetical protein